MYADDFYKELGQNIRTLRKMHGITQKQLARSIQKSLACVSKYENGESAIDAYTLRLIAEQLGVSLHQLAPDAAHPVETLPAGMNPFFARAPLYLFWYRGGKGSLVQHVIDIDISTLQVACYMEADDLSDYKKCKYMMFGRLFFCGPNTYIYATNPVLKEDFIFACFNNMDLFDSQMIGFLSCLNRSFHVTSTKCFISATPTHAASDILDAISVTKEEISEFKRSNFFTFGSHKRKI